MTVANINVERKLIKKGGKTRLLINKFLMKY